MLAFFGRKASIKTATDKRSGWSMVLKNGFDYIVTVLNLLLGLLQTESLLHCIPATILGVSILCIYVGELVQTTTKTETMLVVVKNPV